jgi:hypothetical protein
MVISEILTTYIYYLIHPFKTHDIFMRQNEDEPELINLSVYESLGTSWVFVVLNGIVRIVVLNLLLTTVLSLIQDSSLDLGLVFDINEIPGYSFFVLSAVLDVIFYPLFGFFIIQYWEMIIKLIGKLLQIPGDLSKKAQDIISVTLSANIFKIVPVFGAPAQSLASMILMYAGLRKQLNASPVLSVCIILSPVFFMMALFSIVLLFILLML